MDKKERIQKIIQYKDEIDNLMHNQYHELAKSHNLTVEQYNLLVELDELMLDVFDESNAPTVGQLAKNINNCQNTVSERVSRLENKGLVKRIKDANDKRISRVYLTENGRNVIASIQKQASSKFLFNSIASMEDEEIRNLMDSLGKLADKMRGI